MNNRVEAFKNALYAYEFGLITFEDLNARVYTLNNTKENNEPQPRDRDSASSNGSSSSQHKPT